MTYLKPKQWYLYLFKFTAQCQNTDFKTLHEKYNVNCFDIRIFWDADGNLEFRHGIFSYNADDIGKLFDYANVNKLSIRLFFEERNYWYLKNRSQKYDFKNKFKHFCKHVAELYPDVIFYGGVNTETGELLYDFKNHYPEIHLYASQAPKLKHKILGLFPKLYAWMFNKKNMKEHSNENKDENMIVLYDFVNKN